jgi:hypothetical protein
VAERQLPKLNVAGSIPVSRSIIFNNLSGHSKSVLHLCSIEDQKFHKPLKIRTLLSNECAPLGIDAGMTSTPNFSIS